MEQGGSHTEMREMGYYFAGVGWVEGVSQMGEVSQVGGVTGVTFSAPRLC